jgi:hypothetical protein
LIADGAVYLPLRRASPDALSSPDVVSSPDVLRRKRN